MLAISLTFLENRTLVFYVLGISFKISCFNSFTFNLNTIEIPKYFFTIFANNKLVKLLIAGTNQS